jgi:hypothetical protein
VLIVASCDSAALAADLLGGRTRRARTDNRRQIFLWSVADQAQRPIDLDIAAALARPDVTGWIRLRPARIMAIEVRPVRGGEISAV